MKSRLVVRLYPTPAQERACEHVLLVTRRLWNALIGQRRDAWKTRPDPSWSGAPSFGRGHMPYDDSRGYFRGEADFPGPRTLGATARWIEENAGVHDRFFLMVDEFDPHEPFDTPEPYASLYDPDWEGPHMIWPPYVVGAKQRVCSTTVRRGRSAPPTAAS